MGFRWEEDLDRRRRLRLMDGSHYTSYFFFFFSVPFRSDRLLIHISRGAVRSKTRS